MKETLVTYWGQKHPASESINVSLRVFFVQRKCSTKIQKIPSFAFFVQKKRLTHVYKLSIEIVLELVRIQCKIFKIR